MEAVVQALRDALPAGRVQTGDEINPRHYSDWTRFQPNRPLALIVPRSTDEVSRTLAICHAHAQAVVPQGGLTGLVAGAHPAPSEIAVSLEGMSGIENVDGANATLIALAGTPLEIVQKAAEEAGFVCGLDLGARGSCTIGGNVATNAGGLRVVRYGMARQHVLGLEVVLADGTIVSALNTMTKNNCGYDVKQMFIGSEGTLGIITRVVLHLLPPTRSIQCALLGVKGYSSAIGVLRRSQSALGGTLSAFELMWPEFYTYMTDVVGTPSPLNREHAAYLLIEAEGSDPDADADRFERFLAELYEDGVIADAVIAKTLDQRARLWAVRENVAEFARLMPGRVAFDISFPLSRMEAAIAAIREEIGDRWPNAIRLFHGHLGDGNLHVVVFVPGAPEQPREAIEQVVYAIVGQYGGAVSAEHGIGRHKREFLRASKTEQEIDLMRQIKRALDPKGILNPNKIL
jgi:FAD/FMN-containing dehydrogenase